MEGRGTGWENRMGAAGPAPLASHKTRPFLSWGGQEALAAMLSKACPASGFIQPSIHGAEFCLFCSEMPNEPMQPS